MNEFCVVYRGRCYIAKMSLRESLFYELKQCNPDHEVLIYSNETGARRYVRIAELDLWSYVRHL